MLMSFGVTIRRSDSHTPRPACAAIRAMLPPGETLYLYGAVRLPVMYYLDAEPLRKDEHSPLWADRDGVHLVVRVGRQAELAAFIRGEKPLFVAMQDETYRDFLAPDSFTVAEVGRAPIRRGALVLARIEHRPRLHPDG
jgi:hypothetical protein